MRIRKFKVILTIITFAVFFSPTQSISQFIFYDKGESTKIAEVKSFIQSGRSIIDSFQRLNYPVQTTLIHEVGEKIWMTFDGRFDVFEWQENRWENLYKGNLHGYNHKSQRFVFDDRLFSFRGYGFWRNHGEIIEFLPEQGGWELIHASKEIPFGIGYMVDSLFYIHSKNCFEVNLLKQEVQEVDCRYSIRDEVPQGREYHFQDYVLISGFLQDRSHLPLIEKKTGKVFLTRRQPFKALRDTQFHNSIIHTYGNTMQIIFPDDRIVKYRVDEELRHYIQEPKEFKIEGVWTWVWLIFGILLLGRKIYKQYKSRIDSKSTFYPTFNQYRGQRLDSSKLDQILGIDHIIVHETRRHKRATLIREINHKSKSKYDKTLIVREKNPEDKRFFLYYILP